MISVELWRARIGLFNCRSRSPCCNNNAGYCKTRISSWLFSQAWLDLPSVVLRFVLGFMDTTSYSCTQFFSVRGLSVLLRHAVVLLFLAVVARQLLMTSGDIELNPGPTIIELDQQPKMKEIQCISFTNDVGATVKFRLMDRLRPRWRDLAIALGFPGHSIAAMERKDQPEAVYYLFDEWLRGANLDEDPRPLTWRTLITALRDANIHEEANTLEMLCRQESAAMGSQSGDHSVVSSLSQLNLVMPTLTPMEQFRQYLRDTYMQTKFPTYFKKSTVSYNAQEFINLALVHKESDHHLTNEERKENIMQKLHGNVDRIARKKTELEISDVGKYENSNKITELADNILVEGAPGVGKTTFAWKISQEWAIGKLLQEWSIVFLVQLRDQGVREAKTLHDLFYHPDPAVRQNICSELLRNYGKSVLVIIDGYDELSDSQRECSSIFQQLVTKRLLPRVTLMILSRPTATITLPKQFSEHVDQHIEILGFTEENIDCYITSACSDDPGLADTINSYLSSHPFTYSIMYNPLQCAIVIDLYRIHWKCKDKKFAPRTMTELYTDLVRTLLLRHLSTHPEYSQRKWAIDEFTDLPGEVYEQFKALAQLAARGIEERVYVFDSGVPEESLGLMHVVEEVYPGRGESVSYSFLHLTLQEYLAAYYFSKDPDELGVENTIETLFPPKSFIQKYSETTPSNSKTYTHWPVLLFNAGITKLRWCTYLHTLLHDSSDHCLSLLHLLYETQDFELVHSALVPPHPNDQSLIITLQTALDFFVAGYCIPHSNRQWLIYASSKQRVFTALSKGLTLASSTGKIVAFLLRDNKCLPLLLSPQLRSHIEQLRTLIVDSDEFSPMIFNVLPFKPVTIVKYGAKHYDKRDLKLAYNESPLPASQQPSSQPDHHPNITMPSDTGLVDVRHIALCILELNNCEIPRDACAAFVYYIQSPHCVLQILEMTSIKSQQSLEDIVKAVGNNHSLKQLILTGMPGTSCHLDPLITSVVSNTTLEKLTVLFNFMPFYGHEVNHPAFAYTKSKIDLVFARPANELVDAVNRRSTIEQLTLNKYLEPFVGIRDPFSSQVYFDRFRYQHRMFRRVGFQIKFV